MNDFQSLGNQFRQAREARDLELADIEKTTRIRLKFLQAIERGEFAVIPSPVQLRGFLRNYAHAVGLDEDTVLRLYEEALNPRRKPRRTTKPTAEIPVAKPRLKSSQDAEVTLTAAIPTRIVAPPSQPPSAGIAATHPPNTYAPTQKNIFRTLLAIILAAIVTGGIVVGAIVVIEDATDPTIEPTSNAILLLSPPPLVTSAPNLRTLTPQVVSTLPPTPLPTFAPILEGESIYIQITVKRRVWLQLIVDGELKYEGLFVPQQEQGGIGYDVNATFSIRASDAGGVTLSINQQEYKLGDVGEMVDLSFTREGLTSPNSFNPPPDINPTLSETPSLTPTLAASITATPTSPTNTALELNGQTSPTSATLSFVPAISATATGFLIATPFLSPTFTLTVPASLTPTSTVTPSITVFVPSPTSTIPSLTPSATNTVAPTQPPPPTLPPVGPTLTPSPFLPPRETRTPTLEKPN